MIVIDAPVLLALAAILAATSKVIWSLRRKP